MGAPATSAVKVPDHDVPMPHAGISLRDCVRIGEHVQYRTDRRLVSVGPCYLHGFVSLCDFANALSTPPRIPDIGEAKLPLGAICHLHVGPVCEGAIWLGSRSTARCDRTASRHGRFAQQP